MLIYQQLKLKEIYGIKEIQYLFIYLTNKLVLLGGLARYPFKLRSRPLVNIPIVVAIQ